MVRVVGAGSARRHAHNPATRCTYALRRDDVVRVVGEAVAAVGRPSTKGGIVRDALVAGWVCQCLLAL